MKIIVTFISWLCIHGVAFSSSITPSSPAWSDIYTPAYRIPTELKLGDPVRKKLFEQLRESVNPSKTGKNNTFPLFKGTLKSFKNWAFFEGEVVDNAGRTIVFPPFENSDAVALWINTQNGWVLVAYSVGHSDVFYDIWPAQYGAPCEFFFSEKNIAQCLH